MNVCELVSERPMESCVGYFEGAEKVYISAVLLI